MPTMSAGDHAVAFHGVTDDFHRSLRGPTTCRKSQMPQ